MCFLSTLNFEKDWSRSSDKEHKSLKNEKYKWILEMKVVFFLFFVFVAVLTLLCFIVHLKFLDYRKYNMQVVGNQDIRRHIQ